MTPEINNEGSRPVIVQVVTSDFDTMVNGATVAAQFDADKFKEQLARLSPQQRSAVLQRLNANPTSAEVADIIHRVSTAAVHQAAVSASIEQFGINGPGDLENLAVLIADYGNVTFTQNNQANHPKQNGLPGQSRLPKLIKTLTNWLLR